MRFRFYIAVSSLLVASNLALSAELNLNDIKWPPYFFPRLEAKLQQGIAKEILNICIAKQNYKINYKNLPVKRTHLYMQSGELDISVYSYKRDREEYVVYGKEPIFKIEYGFASSAVDNIQINQLSDIRQYRFGHLAGLSHTPELMEIVEEKRRSDQVSEGYDLDAMFGQLLATPQRFDIMANSKETFLWRARQLGIADEIKVHDFTIKVKPYYVTVSKSSKNIKNIEQFLNQVDQCLVELKETGQYHTITDRYGL